MKKNNCFIISEIGVNHNGDIDLAKQMILASKEAGADAVKFQTFTAKSLVSKATPKVAYQKETTNTNESHYEMIKSLEMSKDDHIPIIQYCKDLDIQFISTPYDVESAKFLYEAGVKTFKTASADIVDLLLHEYLANTGKPVIISTGMATLEEIDEVIEIYRRNDNMNITLLHCVSNYPCKFESLNLSVITSLKKRYNLPVGYSDHAIGYIPAVASILLGAVVIEKHFTLDKNLPGPDHKASSTPEEFKELVDSIRLAEISLGDPIKRVQKEEEQMREIARKSLFYSRKLLKGDILLLEDLTLKRPGTGLLASYIPSLIGKKLACDISTDSMVSLKDFE